MVAIGTKLDPAMTRSDSFIGSVIGKPGTLPENSTKLKLEVNLFDSAVGTTEDVKVQPIQSGELLRLNIGTAPVLGKVTKIKSKNILKLNLEDLPVSLKVEMLQLVEELLKDGD